MPQDLNVCPKRDLTPTHVGGPFIAFHLAPTLDRREEARAPVHGTHCVPPPPLPARDRFCFDAPCLGLSSLFLVLDFSLEESSIRRSTESPPHLNIVFKRPHWVLSQGPIVDFCARWSAHRSQRNGAGQSGPFFVLQRE